MAEKVQALIGGTGPNWQVREVDIPDVGPGQVLVQVRAAGLNRADLYMLEGSYSPNSKTSNIYTAGLEMAGEVVAVGDGVTTVRVGDRVAAAGLGAFAQYAVQDARHVITMPDTLSWPESAALPVGLATEHDALVTQGGFAPGMSVLIVGATTAIGLIAVQMARALGASLIAATTTSEHKTAALTDAGADVVINTGHQNLAEAILTETNGTGVDIVLDHVGGQLFADTFPATRLGGTIINIGRLAGPQSTIDLNALAFRRLRVLGTTFSVRTPDELAAVCSALKPEILPAVAAGLIRPVIDRVFDFGDALEAADYLRSNAAVGKIVLEMGRP